MLKSDPEVLLTELNDGTGVLLDLRSKFYFTLNRTGVFVWKLIAEQKAPDVDTIVDALTSAFDGGERAVVTADTEALLAELIGDGLVTDN